MILALISWIAIAAWVALIGYGVRTALIWAHLPSSDDPRTFYAGVALLSTSALLFFAIVAPSANIVFATIAPHVLVIAAVFALIGFALLLLARGAR